MRCQVKLVKALKAVSKKKADLEDELADEQDRGSKLEESVKELAAQARRDGAASKLWRTVGRLGI